MLYLQQNSERQRIQMKKNKTKLLVVDDTATVRECMQYYFEQKGYIVFSAASGEEALPIIKKHKLDIMLLDINLPQMNGIELLKLVRQFDKALKVIIVSGEVKNFRDNPHLKQLDILAFMDKPIDFFELESFIKKAVA